VTEALPTIWAQVTPITEAEAQAIAVEAYVYFYPLVTMDVTRKQFTNLELGKELGKGPMNLFNNIPEYSPANFKGVVRPDFDTLYSVSYLDMTIIGNPKLEKLWLGQCHCLFSDPKPSRLWRRTYVIATGGMLAKGSCHARFISIH
jgi:hypothetical protein